MARVPYLLHTFFLKPFCTGRRGGTYVHRRRQQSSSAKQQTSSAKQQTNSAKQQSSSAAQQSKVYVKYNTKWASELTVYVIYGTFALPDAMQ